MRTLVILVALSTLAAGEATDLKADVDRLAAPLVEAEIVVGMTVGVVRGDQRQTFGYGRLSPGTEGAPDGDTLYEIGSITKVFTGYLLADMVCEGTVRLDQPVRELLPEGTRVPKFKEQEITLSSLAGRILEHLAGVKTDPPKVRRAVAVDPKILETCTGRYMIVPGVLITVTRDERGLWIQLTGQPKVRIYPESETSFFLRVVVAQIDFEKDEEGKVVRLILNQNGRRIVGTRLAEKPSGEKKE